MLGNSRFTKEVISPKLQQNANTHDTHTTPFKIPITTFLRWSTTVHAQKIPLYGPTAAKNWLCQAQAFPDRKIGSGHGSSQVWWCTFRIGLSDGGYLYTVANSPGSGPYASFPTVRKARQYGDHLLHCSNSAISGVKEQNGRLIQLVLLLARLLRTSYRFLILEPRHRDGQTAQSSLPGIHHFRATSGKRLLNDTLAYPLIDY